MEKITGLKIGTEENQKVLIDEFGSPTKIGLAAAGLAALSALGGLILTKNVLAYLLYRMFRKTKKRALKARKKKARIRNKEQKKIIRQKDKELRKKEKQLRASLKNQAPKLPLIAKKKEVVLPEPIQTLQGFSLKNMAAEKIVSLIRKKAGQEPD